MTRTLLLNSNYQILAFISERKAIKLLIKEKVEVLSTWKGRKIRSPSGFIEYPATLKMKYHIALSPTKLSFSKKLVLRRDNYTCSYCLGKYKNLTIDHVIPKSLGGENSFTNCVAACMTCNRKKGNRTPEQAGMSLKVVPMPPSQYLCHFPGEVDWHDDWLFFIRRK